MEAINKEKIEYLMHMNGQISAVGLATLGLIKTWHPSNSTVEIDEKLNQITQLVRAIRHDILKEIKKEKGL